MFKARCLVCRRIHTAESINNSILDMEHHPKCDANKLNRVVQYEVIDLGIAEDFEPEKN